MRLRENIDLIIRVKKFVEEMWQLADFSVQQKLLTSKEQFIDGRWWYHLFFILMCRMLTLSCQEKVDSSFIHPARVALRDRMGKLVGWGQTQVCRCKKKFTEISNSHNTSCFYAGFQKTGSI